MCKTVVTDVRVFFFTDENRPNVKAVSRVTLNKALVLNGILIVDDQGVYTIEYPTIDNKRKNYHSCFPIQQELREHIYKEVVGKYTMLLSRSVNGDA